MTLRLRFLAFPVLLAACHGDAGLGAPSPSLSGTVASTQHGPIARARVVATDSANPTVSDTAISDSVGHYVFNALTPGTRVLSLIPHSLPGACYPPPVQRAAVAAHQSPIIALDVRCVLLAGTYSGYVTVTTGGDAAALESEIVALGLAPFFPDSAGLTLAVQQFGDTLFGIDMRYAPGTSVGVFSSGMVSIEGPVVASLPSPVNLDVPPITFQYTPGYPIPPFSITITTTCAPTTPQTVAVTIDSAGTGHLAGIVSDLAYACSVAVSGLSLSLSGTFAFHVVVVSTQPQT